MTSIIPATCQLVNNRKNLVNYRVYMYCVNILYLKLRVYHKQHFSIFTQGRNNVAYTLSFSDPTCKITLLDIFLLLCVLSVP